MKKTKYKGIYSYTHKDGTTSYYIRPTIAGSRTWRKAGDTITEAKELLREYRHSKRLEGFGENIPQDIRFDKLVKLYISDYCKQRMDTGLPNLSRLQSITKRLLEHFGSMRISQLTALEIDLAALPRQESIYLKAILNKAVRWNFLNRLPEIKIPKARPKINRIVSHDELKVILKQATPLHRDAILLCLAMGGLRIGELCKITQDNTNFIQGTVDIPDRKAGVPKRFYLSDFAASILRRRFLENGGVAFKQTARQLIQRFIYERQKMKGVKHWRFHDLRHTITDILGRNQIDLETTRQILGHTKLTTTQRYMHSTETKERSALELVEQELSRLTS